MEGTIAILGAGLNLAWLSAPWISSRRLAYWGDIDTWGLTMLATARLKQPTISALLMSENVLNQYAAQSAVVEAVPAATTTPEELNSDEKLLYERLLKMEKGRLEQEFLPESIVHCELHGWAKPDGQEITSGINGVC